MPNSNSLRILLFDLAHKQCNVGAPESIPKNLKEIIKRLVLTKNKQYTLLIEFSKELHLRHRYKTSMNF